MTDRGTALKGEEMLAAKFGCWSRKLGGGCVGVGFGHEREREGEEALVEKNKNHD